MSSSSEAIKVKIPESSSAYPQQQGPLAHKKMGDMYFAQHNMIQAAQEYTLVCSLNNTLLHHEIILKLQKYLLTHPQDEACRMCLINCLQAHNLITEAIDELEELLELSPAHEKALDLLVQLSIHNKNKEKMVVFLEKAIDHSLKNPNVINILLSYYLDKNDLQKALHVQERVFHLKNNDLEVLQNIIELNITLENYSAVAEYFDILTNINAAAAFSFSKNIEIIIQKQGKNKDLYYSIVKVCLKNLKPDKAILYYEKTFHDFPQEIEKIEKELKQLLQTFPDFPEALLLLAEIYSKQKKYSEAVAVLNKVLRSNPVIYGEAVAKEYREILRLCENQALALQSLGEYLLAKSEYISAVDIFNKLLDVEDSMADFIIQKCRKIIKQKNIIGAHYLLGKAYLKKKNYPKAIEIGEYIIKASEDFSEGYALLGEALFAQNKIKECLSVLKKALLLNPYNKKIHEAYARAEYLSLEKQIHMVQSQYSEDKWRLTLAFIIGKLYFLMGAIEDAVPFLQRALKDTTVQKEAYTLLGMSYKELGRYDLAVLQFKQALEVDQNTLTQDERLKLFLYQGIAEEAFGHVNTAIALYEKVAIENTQFKNISIRLDRISKYSESAANEQMVLGIKNKENSNSIVYSWVFNKENNYTACKTKHNPLSFSVTHNNKAVESMLKGRIKDAENELQVALSLDKNIPAAYNNLALIYMAEKKWDEAETHLLKALLLNQKSDILFANMGLLYFLRGDLSKAEQYYNEALALNDDLQACQINLGDILYQNGKIQDAIVFWQRALELSPLPEIAQRRLMWKVVE